MVIAYYSDHPWDPSPADGVDDSGQPGGHRDCAQWLSEILTDVQWDLFQSYVEMDFSILGAETQR